MQVYSAAKDLLAAPGTEPTLNKLAYATMVIEAKLQFKRSKAGPKSAHKDGGSYGPVPSWECAAPNHHIVVSMGGMGSTA